MNMRNKEGYLDLTAHEALTNVWREQKRRCVKGPVVFICSPYAGDVVGNTMRAKRYARFATTKNTVPVIPHLMYPQFLFDDDPDERLLGLDMGLVLLEKCSEVWVFGDLVSAGMKVEIEKARKRNIPIRHFSIDCREV